MTSNMLAQENAEPRAEYAVPPNHSMKPTPYTFYEMDEASARQIADWRYDPPYGIYNCDPDQLEEHILVLLNPQYHYYTVRNEAGELIAFRCFGEDAQVPGGAYRAEALDMGGGLRPDLTGKGFGASVIEAAFEFARHNFAPKPKFRTLKTSYLDRWPTETFNEDAKGNLDFEDYQLGSPIGQSAAGWSEPARPGGPAVPGWYKPTRPAY